MPSAMPERAPPKKPPQDFPSPNILLPRQDLPKSIFVPPPKTTAAELGSIAGRNSQRPFSVYEMTSKASIGIWMRGTSIKLKVPFLPAGAYGNGMAYASRREREVRCSLEYGMKTFGGKWKLGIVCVLNVKGALRYSDPRRGLVNVSDTVLSSALRELEVGGIVGRTQYGGSPSGWSTP